MLGQGRIVFSIYDDARISGHLGDGTPVGADEGRTASHGFQNRQAKPFDPGGEDKRLGIGEQDDQIFPRGANEQAGVPLGHSFVNDGPGVGAAREEDDLVLLAQIFRQTTPGADDDAGIFEAIGQDVGPGKTMPLLDILVRGRVAHPS